MLFHKEQLDPLQWAGIAAVIAGLVFFQLGERRPKAR